MPVTIGIVYICYAPSAAMCLRAHNIFGTASRRINILLVLYVYVKVAFPPNGSEEITHKRAFSPHYRFARSVPVLPIYQQVALGAPPLPSYLPRS
jgi:hypothetical protein